MTAYFQAMYPNGTAFVDSLFKALAILITTAIFYSGMIYFMFVLMQMREFTNLEIDIHLNLHYIS